MVSPPVNELHMGEGEVPHLPVELPLPLAVDAHLGHLDDVTNLQGDNWNIIEHHWTTNCRFNAAHCIALSHVGLELIYSLQIILLLTSSLRAVLS